jgi:NADH-quinone oxidoreductase subunit I
MAIVVKRPRLSLLERLYVTEVIRGMAITFGHFIRNVFNTNALPTLNYPEQKRTLPAAFRGLHRLLKEENGTLKCTACKLCAAACPSSCIEVEAGPHPDPAVKRKYPARYTIDIGRCIFCGYCVEACPFAAIDMKSGMYELAGPEPGAFSMTKEKLSSW